MIQSPSLNISDKLKISINLEAMFTIHILVSSFTQFFFTVHIKERVKPSFKKVFFVPY